MWNRQVSFRFFYWVLLIMLCNIPLYGNNQNELKLPMPNGGEMAFVPVCVNHDGGSFGWKKIKLGDPSGGIMENSASIALGGSFPLEQNGKKVWCFYMGKNEVTRKQYFSIIDPRKPSADIEKKDYPITNVSWFDAINFSNLYNQWLFSNFEDSLPKSNKSSGFLRLPSEEEWEFAARGASAVSTDFFNRKTPYPPEKIQEYEWFGGPTSSHYKLQPVGKLKANPIGLHDMLGNADEITVSLFKVAYNQGRAGGFVIKGNNYYTARNKLRSSFRSEQPFYQPDKKGIPRPHSKPTLGFRLIISAIVFSSPKVHQKMSSEWGAHQDSQNTDASAAKSIDSVRPKTIVKSEDMLPYLGRLAGRLGQDRPIHSKKTGDIVGQSNRSIRDIITIQRSKEEHSGYLWIKIANEQANYIRKETQKLPVLKMLIKIAEAQNNPEKTQAYQKWQSERIHTILNAFSTYLYSIKQIAKNTPKAAQNEFARYLLFITKYHNIEQMRIAGRVQEHFTEFLENRQVNPGKWKNEIIRLN